MFVVETGPIRVSLGDGFPILSCRLLLIFSVALTVEQLQDLRDVREDLEAQVVTLPSGLGPRRARRMSGSAREKLGVQKGGAVGSEMAVG